MTNELKAQNKEALWRYLEGLKTGDPDRGLTNPEHDVLVVQWAVLRITELEQQLDTQNSKLIRERVAKETAWNERDALQEQLADARSINAHHALAVENDTLRSQLQAARDALVNARQALLDDYPVIARQTIDEALAAGQD